MLESTPATPQVTLALRGAPQVRVDGTPRPLAALDGALLAWLALEGATPRERLAALLWPHSDPASARNALRQRLFRLRRQAGVDLVDGGAVLQLAAGVVHDLGAVDAAGPLEAAALLAELPLPECPALDEWLRQQRAARLAEARRGADQRIAALEQAGDPAAALPLALALLQRDPLSEDAHRRVMRLHYLRGDRAAALLAFDRCEAVLKHEVGTAPSPATLALLRTVQAEAAPAPAEGAAAASAALPASVLRPPRLVGRDAELAALRAGLGAGTVTLVVGEAGLGKSRLLQAVGRNAAADFPATLYSTARPGDALVPYATLARLLRAVAERLPDAADAALRAELAPLLPEWAAPGLPPALARLPLAPVAALLQRAAPRLPVLLLDDLHFADDATLELMQGLLPGAAEQAPGTVAGPVWALGLRPPLPDTPLHGLVDALARSRPCVHLRLAPLGVAQVAEFVDALALPGVQGEALAPALHQRTGGNPLFLLETLKLAWRDGSLARPDALPRPQSLDQLIAGQLARLSAGALQLARVAAVAGVDFGIDIAEALSGRGALDLADDWRELETRHVLHQGAFAHDLVHDAVLQALPEPIARHLHGRAAAWLQDHGGEPGRIAAHWLAAGQRARAVPALRAAAERAHRALREGERIALLLQAADLAEAGGRGDEAFDLVRSAIAGHMNTIRQTDGLPLLDRLDALAATPLQRARAAADRAWYSAVLGDLDAAVAQGTAALAQAQALDDPALLATVRQRLGTTLGMAGRFGQALPHLDAAAPWIEAHAAPDERAEFEGNLAVVLDNLGRPAEALVHHRRALAGGGVPGDPGGQGDQAARATLLANFAASRLEAGDLAQAGALAGQAQRIVAGFELAGSSAGFVATLLAQCDRAAGRYRLALQWCDRAEAILAARHPARLPVARLHRANVWLDLGQHARALQLLEGDALAAALALPPRYAVRAWLLRARVQGRLGLDDAAALAQAAALAPADGWPGLRLLVRTEQARAQAATDPQAALAMLRSVADEAAASGLHGAELGAL
ncbi:MAG: AAA family ATPase, partial [Rubrivivax sp.]|nr:AAA family ATPase [Rubrivivax sp.]